MKMRDESEVVKFTDVAGIGDAKIELAEIVDFFRKPEKFKASGAKVPKGVMLTGPPGCGKTLLAPRRRRRIRRHILLPHRVRVCGDVRGRGRGARSRSLRAGEEAGAVHHLHRRAGRHRSPRGAGGSGNDERDQTLNQLLVELDGFGSDSKVVCIAATNRIDVLDKALVRAGRFDRKITVQLPTREGRLQILKVHVRDKPLAPDVDLLDLAAEMNGFSGAIIANVVNNACLAAAREGRQDICQANFDAAVEAEQLGKTLPIDRGEANDRRLARVHAACAVATVLLMKDVCKLNFVSIIPRETNLDGCVSLKDFPEVERPGAMTRAILTRHTRACFVPQLAEEEHYGFDDVSFAAAPYTARAREIATMMVTSAGMAREGSRLNYVPATDQFMIADFLRSDVVEFLLRSTTADRYFESDREARAMLQEEHAAARRFVARQKAAIDAVADALFEKKSLDGEAVEAILPSPRRARAGGRGGRVHAGDARQARTVDGTHAGGVRPGDQRVDRDSKPRRGAEGAALGKRDETAIRRRDARRRRGTAPRPRRRGVGGASARDRERANVTNSIERREVSRSHVGSRARGYETSRSAPGAFSSPLVHLFSFGSVPLGAGGECAATATELVMRSRPSGAKSFFPFSRWAP